MNLLALDPGISTGFATSAGVHGVWRLAAATSEHAGRRLQRLEDRLRFLHDAWPIDQIVYEASPQITRGQSARLLHAQFLGIILKFAAEIGAPVQEVHPSTVKALAGSGRYQKHQMRRAAKIKLGIDLESEDECDALWVLQWALHPDARAAAKKPKPKRTARRKSPQKMLPYVAARPIEL